MKKKIGTIDCAPKWIELYPDFEKWIKEGTEEQKQFVCTELQRLCKIADAYVELTKSQKSLTNNRFTITVSEAGIKKTLQISEKTHEEVWSKIGECIWQAENSLRDNIEIPDKLSDCIESNDFEGISDLLFPD